MLFHFTTKGGRALGLPRHYLFFIGERVDVSALSLATQEELFLFLRLLTEGKRALLWRMKMMELSESDWSSEVEGPSELNSAINAHFVRLMSSDFRSVRVATRRRYPRQWSTPEGHQARQARALWGGAVGLSLATSGPGAGAKRNRVGLREMLCGALTVGEESKATMEGTAVDELAKQIVSAIRESEDSAEIASAIVRNLSDPLNTALRHSVLSGEVTPQALVEMDEEQLLNPELRRIRREQRLERLEQKSVEFVQRLTSVVTHLYKCPECGGEECYANFRNADFVKWHGDDPNPTLLTCTKCGFSFRQ